jgi:hypothetical protein
MANINVGKGNTFEEWRTKTNSISDGIGDVSTMTTAATDIAGAINEVRTLAETGGSGTVGASGKSVFVGSVYKRSDTAPATPSSGDGSYNFTTHTLTPPSGWDSNVPGGTDPVYVCSSTFKVTGLTGTDTSPVWSTPTQVFKEGSVWHSGVGAPATGLGSPGDFYIDTNTENVYKNNGGVWSLDTNLLGAAGDSVNIIFQDVANQPAKPAASDLATAVAAGWTDVAPAVTVYKLFSSVGIQTNSTGNYAWGEVIKMSGDDGGAGTTWFSGTTVPANSLGNNGDFYLRTGNEDVYEKAAGSWAISLNIGGSGGGDNFNWVFIDAASLPTKPSPSPGTPTGWTDTYPATVTNAIYAVVGRQVAGTGNYTWSEPFKPAGTDGADGPPGATWYSGAGSPATSLGINGDFYLQTDSASGSEDVFKKSGGTWSADATLAGSNGVSVNAIFIESATEPATPSASTLAAVISAGWSDTTPATHTNPIWSSIGKNTTSAETIFTWQTPTQTSATNGTDGINGATWLQGTIDPAANQGQNDDYYLKIGTEEVWKKISGAWEVQTTLSGSNATDINWIFQPAASAPSTPSPTGFDSSTPPVAIVPTGWYESPPASYTSGHLMFTSIGRRTAGVGNFVWDTAVQLSGEEGPQGADSTVVGPAGDAGKKSITGIVYYSSNNSSNPGTPTATSYTFSTNAFSGLTSGWSFTAPVIDVGQSNKYWHATFTSTETTAGGNTGPVTFTATTALFSFDGVVRFTNSNTIQNSTGQTLTVGGLLGTGGAAADINNYATTIHGNKITTGTIDADSITTGTLNASVSLSGSTISGGIAGFGTGGLIGKTVAQGAPGLSPGVVAFTAPSGNYWEGWDATPVVALNAGNRRRFWINNTGNVYTSDLVNYGHLYTASIGASNSGATPSVGAKNAGNGPAVKGVIGGASAGGSTAGYFEVESTVSSTSSHAVRGQNNFSRSTSPTRVQTAGLIGAANNFNFYADGQGGDYGPFTGAHDGLLPIADTTTELGDIVIDSELIESNGFSNTIFKMERSTRANQKGALGVNVMNSGLLSGLEPAVFIVEHVSADSSDPDSVDSRTMSANYEAIKDDYNVIAVNALGEGQMNVVKENGNIAKGDLIVCSSTPGKGMKQTGEAVKSFTVARARCAVTWTSSETDVRLVPCIYLCG